MSKFTETIREMLILHEHTAEMLADAIGISQDDMALILDDKLVPSRDFVSDVGEMYHLDKKSQGDFERAWVDAKKKLHDSQRRAERRESALVFLRSRSGGPTIAERRCYVLAFAQYIHNTYIDGGVDNPIIEKVMNMRAEYVYNLGSTAAYEADKQLLDEKVWADILNEVKRII